VCRHDRHLWGVGVTEQELTRAIVERLNAIPGVCCWRANAGVSRSGGRFVRFGVVGQADISGLVRGGKRVELETKLPGGKWKVTAEQLAFGARITDLGGLWAVVRSVDEAVAVVEGALRNA
jgi:hypothetical protein